MEPDFTQLPSENFNSLRQYPHLVARLPQRVSPQETGIALRALLRRDSIDPGARVELFERLAAHFHAVVEFPGKATEGIAAEEYLRNMGGVLFNYPLLRAQVRAPPSASCCM